LPRYRERPALPADHLAGVALDTDIETIAAAAHSAQLDPYQPLNDYSRFLVPFLSPPLPSSVFKSEG